MASAAVRAAGRWTPRLRYLDHRHRRKSELTAGHFGAAEIVPEQVTFRALFQPAHGSNEKPHGATLQGLSPWNDDGGSDHHTLHRAVGGPHLL